jgi:hypothetical protein
MAAVLTEKAEGGLDSDILPSKRRSHCHDSIFAEKTAVEATGDVRREKNGRFSNEINAVDVSTGETLEIAPVPPAEPSASLSDDDAGGQPDDILDIPRFLDPRPAAVPHDRRPALGPPGDSLDDLA